MKVTVTAFWENVFNKLWAKWVNYILFNFTNSPLLGVYVHTSNRDYVGSFLVCWRLCCLYVSITNKILCWHIVAKLHDSNNRSRNSINVRQIVCVHKQNLCSGLFEIFMNDGSSFYALPIECTIFYHSAFYGQVAANHQFFLENSSKDFDWKNLDSSSRFRFFFLCILLPKKSGYIFIMVTVGSSIFELWISLLNYELST